MPGLFLLEIALRRIPITPDLDEKLVVRHADLLTRNVYAALHALFFEVTAEKADQRCSTLWLPQCGQVVFSLSCSAMVKIFENVFLQALQKNSYWGIGTSLRKKWMGGILDLVREGFNLMPFCV